MANIIQPQAVNNNIVQVRWTDVQCEFLINERTSRNDEFWSLGSGEKRLFWKDIKNQLNNVFGTTFTTRQVEKKWINLKDDHMASIFYIYIITVNIFYNNILKFIRMK